MTVTTVFTNNRSNAVRLPVEQRLPEIIKRAEVRARGCERIIKSLGQRWYSFFLTGPQGVTPCEAALPARHPYP